MTVITITRVPDPALFEAVTVYDVSATTVPGAPVIFPLVILIERPLGKDGSTLNDIGAPPLNVGTFTALMLPRVYVAAKAVYESIVGGVLSFTSIEMSYVFDPALFPATTANIVGVTTVVGVPASTPEDESRESPAGSVGLTEKLVAEPPVTIGVLGVIALERT